MALMTEEERNTCLSAIDAAIMQMEEDSTEIASLKNQLAEAQSYKANAEQLKLLENSICIFAREKLGNMNFESDKEVIGYILSFTDETIDQARKESK